MKKIIKSIGEEVDTGRIDAFKQDCKAILHTVYISGLDILGSFQKRWDKEEKRSQNIIGNERASQSTRTIIHQLFPTFLKLQSSYLSHSVAPPYSLHQLRNEIVISNFENLPLLPGEAA